MPTLGIELCDAGLQAAQCTGDQPQLLAVESGGSTEWPGYAYHDGQKFWFGRPAEDAWFVHPRRVNHTFWSRLAHEASNLGTGRAAAYSELGFSFLQQFIQRIDAGGPRAEKLVLAVPGSYLKNEATEEEKVGLLLGMAGELKLPLAGIIDMACASLCDPRSHGFNPALPVVVVDLHLEGAELTLLSTDERLERRDFVQLQQSGYAQLLKQLTATMGNRFLRHTAFDILEDGRIEQTFFRQTKTFLLSAAPEHRFQINTASRTYEMVAKREQLASDAQQFVNGLVQGLQHFIQHSPHSAEPCTVALTERTAHLPGLEARLRAAGFGRLLRLPAGAAACGAARIGEAKLQILSDLADVPVKPSAPLALAQRASAAPWEARLEKRRAGGTRPAPTHVIMDGIGHPIGPSGGFTIGNAAAGADLALPEAFSAADDCTVPLVREGGRLWFVDAAPARPAGMTAAAFAARSPVDAGDRITIRCGAASADVLFAHCPATNGRAHD